MRTSLLPAFALLALACGPSPATVEPTKTPADASKEKGAAQVAAPQPTETAYDLSPVPEPEDVVAFFGWKSPAATLTSFGTCAAIPPEPLMGGVEGQLRALLRDVVSSNVDVRSLAAAVSLDAPVFAVASLETQSKRAGAFVAFSLGLTSLEKAKMAVEGAGPVTELGPGMFRIGGRSGSTCVIAASAGATPARLVCGPKEKDVTTLAPYLTRTLPTKAGAASDMHLEVRFAPAEARYGSLLRTQVQGLPVIAQAELAIGEPKFDRAIVDAATGLADEIVAFAQDADKLTLDVSMDPATCLRASASLAMRGKNSWVSGLMGERPERAGPPPAIFWRAPKDSASVFYGRGSDPKRFQPILRTARLLVEGILAKVNVGSEADHRAVGELFDWPMGKDVETVTASGRVEVAEVKGTRTPQQEAEALVNGWIGWGLAGYEEGSANLAKQLRKIADVYNRKGFQDPLRKELGPELSKALPKVKVGPGPAALGPDSLDLSIKIENVPAALLDKSAPQKALVSVEVHVLLMTDGKSRTWLAVGGGKPDGLVKRLLAVKTGAPDAGTIASRTDLEPLRRGTHMGSGFLSMGPLVKSLDRMKDVFGPREDARVQQLIRAVSTMPHQGETPIFVTSSSTGTVDAPRGELAVTASKAAFEDIGWLIKTLGVSGARR
ncbi:hypothetical protein [Polyangium jinanense]|uniref:Lipoprotein n=1 Tax=Polyangium jinanense TaxID=2829994 RepID=A0A9X3WWK4_9BACT|nr:hypothetical protein [Polyangium jinanense]MDC3953366.1 hypothetical protein [Polyangium jinanense]MDC3979514.1 hypothetical protein [Polyangium jinanense]